MTEKTPAIVFHPGEYLRDELKARKISLRIFSGMSRISEALLRDITLEEMGISLDIAEKIGDALGTSSILWINLDKAYYSWLEANKNE